MWKIIGSIAVLLNIISSLPLPSTHIQPPVGISSTQERLTTLASTSPVYEISDLTNPEDLSQSRYTRRDEKTYTEVKSLLLTKVVPPVEVVTDQAADVTLVETADITEELDREEAEDFVQTMGYKDSVTVDDASGGLVETLQVETGFIDMSTDLSLNEVSGEREAITLSDAATDTYTHLDTGDDGSWNRSLNSEEETNNITENINWFEDQEINLEANDTFERTSSETSTESIDLTSFTPAASLLLAIITTTMDDNDALQDLRMVKLAQNLMARFSNTQGTDVVDAISLADQLSRFYMDQYQMTNHIRQNGYGQCDIQSDHPMYLAILSSQAILMADKAHSHYCESSEVQNEIQSGAHTDCQSLTEGILENPDSDFIPVISQVDYENLQNDMQEIHRGVISSYSMLTNISALQVDYLCYLPRNADIYCDQKVIQEEICSAPHPSWLQSTCHLHQLINELIGSYKNLEYQHQRAMRGYGLLPQHSFDNVDVSPLQCSSDPCGSSLTHYTLAGLYSAMLQAQVAEDTFGYLYASLDSCPNV